MGIKLKHIMLYYNTTVPAACETVLNKITSQYVLQSRTASLRTGSQQGGTKKFFDERSMNLLAK